MPDAYSTRFDEALAWAAELHRDEARKGADAWAVPTITHLLRVSALVWSSGGDEDQAIAALLHDAAEDKGGEQMIGEIRARFGGDVADIVRAASDSLVDTTSGAEKDPWTTRKEAHLAHLPAVGERAALVIAADKTDNVEDLLRQLAVEDHDVVFGRFNGKRDGTLWYYRRAADALCPQLPDGLARRLADAVTALEATAGATA